MIGKIIAIKDNKSKWKILDKISIDGCTRYLVIEVSDYQDFPILDGCIITIFPRLVTKVFGQI
jgi:hypothetical protein